MQWTQLSNARTKPKLQENISANFDSDSVKIRGDRQSYGPQNLLLSPGVKAQFKQIALVPPPPSLVIPEEEKSRLRYEVPFRFGNLEFPEDMDFAFPRVTASADANQFEMAKNFLVETASAATAGSGPTSFRTIRASPGYLSPPAT